LLDEEMIVIENEAEPELMAFVREWFKNAARGDWNKALAMLDAANSYGVTWTSRAIVSVLEDTFGPGTRFAKEFGRPAISDPDLAVGSAHHSFGELGSGGYWLDHAVPLNGVFSDLTAQFEFHPRPSGYAVILEELHVL
jgi:hypothetical protein